MPLPAAVGFVINTISNSFIGVPLVLTRISVGAWALKSADELAPGVIYLPKEDPARLAAERELIDKFMREVLPLSTQPSDFAESINSINRKTQTASTIPSPIVLDLDGDGIETISVANGAWFDHAADGFAERSGWVASDDGLLVRDLDGNGTIDSGRELFGSETLLPNGTKAANGFEALKALDANADGMIDAQDTAFSELRVWKDTNANGRTDAGELLTLDEAGVSNVNVAYANSSHTDAQVNAHRQVGSYTTTSGETRSATDIWVQTNPTQSLPTDWVVVPEDIAALPDAQGYGLVRDLHQVMAMDTSEQLKAKVSAFTRFNLRRDRFAMMRAQLTAHSRLLDLRHQIAFTWGSGMKGVAPRAFGLECKRRPTSISHANALH
ncbi:hypothetical protein [Hydrogenophaga sp.]|uniref:hypothetical protein n=1 Tax=Hydrogenophaga sp. TaxID=1904254 RepID=UPI002FC9A3E2